ncbi:DUF6292 family protein [Actinoplanes sp. NPDC048791]|uniref:DUF6292 family protein n=1 Tax=Actinoplanes sp. NPDC048791 TaxID=3154623 RepID=UPI0033D4E3A7
MNNVLPKAHWNPSVEATRPYITAVVKALIARDVKVTESWLDPFYPDPRDATIRINESEALVWNEEQGWYCGEFVCGEQGQRTMLVDSAGLGGGVLPSANDVVDRFLNGVRTAVEVYRRLSDKDGFEGALRKAGEEALATN